MPRGTIGEIWVKGDNVAEGYWNKPDETRHTFGAMLVHPSAGTPDGSWLRTGDLGFLSEDEMFIVGRMKDMLIVYGAITTPRTSSRPSRRSLVVGSLRFQFRSITQRS